MELGLVAVTAPKEQYFRLAPTALSRRRHGPSDEGISSPYSSGGSSAGGSQSDNCRVFGSRVFVSITRLYAWRVTESLPREALAEPEALLRRPPASTDD